jgi:drug/metabolite transporter (DMT)-like permease
MTARRPEQAPRRTLGLFAAGTMLLLCLCWGFQQVAIKLIAADVAPLMQMVIRCGVPALVLGIATRRIEGRRAFRDGTLLPGIFIGVLFALEFLCIAEGLMRTTAAHLVVFLYSAPIFTALGLHALLPGERLAPMQWLGVVTSFGGIVLAFLGGSASHPASSSTGDLLALAAGVAWAATTVGVRSSTLSEASPVKTLFYQQVVAFVLLGAYAWVTQVTGITLSRMVWLLLIFQAIGVALISYAVWYWLLRHYLASRLSVLSLLTPLFGVLFGVLVLHERIEQSFAAGALLVLAGIVIVSGADLMRPPARD